MRKALHLHLQQYPELLAQICGVGLPACEQSPAQSWAPSLVMDLGLMEHVDSMYMSDSPSSTSTFGGGRCRRSRRRLQSFDEAARRPSPFEQSVSSREFPGSTALRRRYRRAIRRLTSSQATNSQVAEGLHRLY